ncbi:MAG: hypothetical protein ABIS03_08840 [Gemmatimonadaceae bacterium]
MNKVNRFARTLAHKAIQKSPRAIQSLFPHTEAYRGRMMAKLYEQSLPAHADTGTILFWVPGGMPLLLHVEAAIAAALQLRGYRVHAIICNSPYRGCAIRTIDDGTAIEQWRNVCGACTAKTSAVLETMGVPYSYNGDYVSEEQRAELWKQTEGCTWDNLETLSYKDLNVGRNVRSSITRYLQGADLDGHEGIVHEYAYSGLVSAAAVHSAFDLHRPSRVMMSHGVYIDWGPAIQVALGRDIPVAAWKASYLSWHFYMRHIDDPLRIDMKKLSPKGWERLREKEFTPEHAARLDRFFADRYDKGISFDMRQVSRFRDDVVELKQKYALGDKPVWAIFAHINWDSVSDYSPMAYPSFDDWMIDTIKHIIDIPEVQWLVKVHPIEAWDNANTGVQKLIERRFPNLPDHVRVVPAEEDISPATMYELLDGGITVYGTAGLELALLGKPVILAGEAHYGAKGFTHEGVTPVVYRKLLKQAATLEPLTPEQNIDVRKYSYSHFIRRQIPLEIVHDPKSAWWAFQISKRKLLLPHADPFVDFVCDRLLDGQDFSMDDELIGQAPRERQDG